MTGGSDDARPPEDGREAVDDAWDALIEEAESDGAAGERAADEKTATEETTTEESVGEEDAVRPVARPTSGPHSAVGKDRLAEPDDEMARLMSGTVEPPPKSPSPSPSPSPSRTLFATGSTHGAPKFESPKSESSPSPVIDAKPDDTDQREPTKSTAREKVHDTPPAKPDTVSGTDEAKDGDLSAKATTPSAPAPSKPSPEPKRPALRVVSDEESAPEPESEPEPRPARASRPAEPETAVASDAPATGGLPWAWIGVGALVLGAAGLFAIRDDGSSKAGDAKARVAVASADPSTPPVREEGPSTDLGSTPPTDADSTPDPPPKPGDPPATPTPRSDDPREPPPGTPPEIAAVFRRLPVSPSDGPPIGGVGANGIHIDDLRMGTEDSSCSGRTSDFSVSARDRVGLCVRVVHPREKEELQVLWEKHGGSTRRSKMVVLPKHAYRTRGYLKLRKEYIGDWTVRILSSDGVELARHDFTVVP